VIASLRDGQRRLQSKSRKPEKNIAHELKISFCNQLIAKKLCFTPWLPQKDGKDAKTCRRPSFVALRRVHCAGLISAAVKGFCP